MLSRFEQLFEGSNTHKAMVNVAAYNHDCNLEICFALLGSSIKYIVANIDMQCL